MGMGMGTCFSRLSLYYVSLSLSVPVSVPVSVSVPVFLSMYLHLSLSMSLSLYLPVPLSLYLSLSLHLPLTTNERRNMIVDGAVTVHGRSGCQRKSDRRAASTASPRAASNCRHICRPGPGRTSGSSHRGRQHQRRVGRHGIRGSEIPDGAFRAKPATKLKRLTGKSAELRPGSQG